MLASLMSSSRWQRGKGRGKTCLPHEALLIQLLLQLRRAVLDVEELGRCARASQQHDARRHQLLLRHPHDTRPRGSLSLLIVFAHAVLVFPKDHTPKDHHRSMRVRELSKADRALQVHLQP